MLESIDVLTERGESLNLPLYEVIGGYMVKDVDGLDPTKATLSTSTFAQLDGVKYHSSRTEPRNLVIQVLLQPDYITETTQGIRRNLYRYLMPKSMVTLTFNFLANTGKPLTISGVVETFETSIFSSEPSVAITLLCSDPDFVETTPTSISGVTAPAGTEGSGISFDYPGSTDTGYEFVMTASRAISGFDLVQTVGTIVKTLRYTGTIAAGDTVTLLTEPGNRNVSVSSSANSVMHNVAPFSDWPMLSPGMNNIQVVTAGTGVPFTLTYTTREGGI